MGQKKCKKSIEAIKASLNRLEVVISSKHVRPADYATRDRLARRLRDAEKAQVLKNARPKKI